MRMVGFSPNALALPYGVAFNMRLTARVVGDEDGRLLEVAHHRVGLCKEG